MSNQIRPGPNPAGAEGTADVGSGAPARRFRKVVPTVQASRLRITAAAISSTVDTAAGAFAREDEQRRRELDAAIAAEKARTKAAAERRERARQLRATEPRAGELAVVSAIPSPAYRGRGMCPLCRRFGRDLYAYPDGVACCPCPKRAPEVASGS